MLSRQLSVLAFLWFFSVPFQAQSEEVKWGEVNEAFQAMCSEQPAVVNTAVFSDTNLKARTIRRDYCTRVIGNDLELFTRTFELFEDLHRIFPDKSYAKTLKLLQARRVSSDKKPAILQFDPDILRLEVDGGYIMLSKNDEKACQKAVRALDASADCVDALQDYVDIYNWTHATYSKKNVDAMLRYLNQLENDWNDFQEKKRSQTLLELAYNGWLFGKNNKERQFEPPPEKQHILFHPSLVIESVSDAIDGEEVEEALMLEVYGLNWWKNDKWYQPSGASLIALYADRASTDDVGRGIAIHFGNKYTIGYADHGGDDGYFISIDLLQLFKDKKKTLEKYRGSYQF